METQSPAKLSRADTIRGIVGALTALIGIGIAASRPMAGYGHSRQFAAAAVCAMLTAACIVLSKSKVAVGLGIFIIIASRLLIGGYFYMHGALHGQ